MKYLAKLLIVFLATHLHAQVEPICDSPSNGSNWRLIGPNSLPELGPKARFAHTGTGAQMRIKFLDADQPSPKILYACMPTSGLFRTLDATAETPVWECVTDSTRLPVLGVRDFELLPADSAFGEAETILLGTGIRYPLDMKRMYGIGILRSPDAGASWEKTGLEYRPTGKSKRWQVVNEIMVDAENPDVIHVLTGPVYRRSTDGGATFENMKTLEHPCPAGWGKSFRDLVAKLDDSQVLFLSSDGNFFYRSEDGGGSWEEFDLRELGVEAETERMDVAVTPQNPNLIYLVCRTKGGCYILRSLDGGLDWEMVFHKRLRTSYERNAVAISPHDVNVLYIGGLFIDRVVLDSTRRRSTAISSGLHLDHRDLLCISDGNGGDIVFSANDGGLYRGILKNKKWEWTDISGIGMNNTQFYGIGVAEDFSVVLGGTQDNGMLVGDRNGNFFKPAIGGDAVDAAVDRYDPKVVYGTTWALQPPTVHRSTDGGQTFGRAIKKSFPGKADTYYFPLETHQDGYLYAGKKKVFRLAPGSEEWEQLGDINLPKDLPYKVTAMCVAPSDSDVIYAYGDKVYRTVNASADSVIWTDVGSAIGRAAKPMEGGGVTSAVEVHAGDPQRVWVGFRVFQNEEKVMYSGDGGRTWENVSQGLPDFPVNALAFQAGTDGVLYAGTDVGVFVNYDADNPTSTWQCFNAGFPVCMVIDLEMNYCAGAIVAGTHGRGIWESPFAVASTFPEEEITSEVTWERRIFRGDVVVRNGNTLTLTGEVRMASGTRITVEKNARLVLDGVQVKPLCGDAWEGIIVEDDLNFFGRFFGDRPGEVELKNGAIVEN